MAQQTSQVWKRLLRTRGTSREYQFAINGVIYGPEQVVSHDVDNGLYETFGIGNAATAKLTLEVYAEDITRGAKIERFVRLKNGEEASEWIPKGIYYINRRAEDNGYWTLEAFDVMRKAETVWEPDQTIVFPMPMPEAAAEFARIMGTTLDPRTTLNPGYTIDYPANDYTLRQELEFIAAAHAGNWIVTDVGRLLLVPLLSIPPETHYLVTEYGDNITLGGVRLLV